MLPTHQVGPTILQAQRSLMKPCACLTARPVSLVPQWGLLVAGTGQGSVQDAHHGPLVIQNIFMRTPTSLAKIHVLLVGVSRSRRLVPRRQRVQWLGMSLGSANVDKGAAVSGLAGGLRPQRDQHGLEQIRPCQGQEQTSRWWSLVRAEHSPVATDTYFTRFAWPMNAAYVSLCCVASHSLRQMRGDAPINGPTLWSCPDSPCPHTLPALHPNPHILSAQKATYGVPAD